MCKWLPRLPRHVSSLQMGQQHTLGRPTTRNIINLSTETFVSACSGLYICLKHRLDVCFVPPASCPFFVLRLTVWGSTNRPGEGGTSIWTLKSVRSVCSGMTAMPFRTSHHVFGMEKIAKNDLIWYFSAFVVSLSLCTSQTPLLAYVVLPMRVSVPVHCIPSDRHVSPSLSISS